MFILNSKHRFFISSPFVSLAYQANSWVTLLQYLGMKVKEMHLLEYSEWYLQRAIIVGQIWFVSIQCQPYSQERERERERESHLHGVCILMKLAVSLYCGCYLSHLLQNVLKSTQKSSLHLDQKKNQRGRSSFTSLEELNQGKIAPL